MRCASDCHQGRRECPTPDACHRPEPDDAPEMLGSMLIFAAAVAGAALIVWWLL